MSRKTAREVAMKLAFARILGGEDTYEAVLDQSGIEETPGEEDTAYAEGIVAGIREHEAELDAAISAHAIGWTTERMPRVDICILRMALYEMLYCEDVPDSVAINEAVELAKRFGGEHSASYINGVLGGASRARETLG